jgi:hypothetical protein
LNPGKIAEMKLRGQPNLKKERGWRSVFTQGNEPFLGGVAGERVERALREVSE